MMHFLPFGNPWGYRFQGAFGNSIQSTREVDQRAGSLYLWGKILSDFLHQADTKSLNSAKSLNNLIPVICMGTLWTKPSFDTENSSRLGEHCTLPNGYEN